MYNYPNLPRYTNPIYVDGLGPGSSYTVPPQLTPFGRFHEPQSENEVNPFLNNGNVGSIAAGGSARPPQPAVPGGIPNRTRLQQLLTGIPDLPPGRQINLPNPNSPVHNHHQMVSMASNLAKFLANQHTASLRRFQYNGRT